MVGNFGLTVPPAPKAPCGAFGTASAAAPQTPCGPPSLAIARSGKAAATRTVADITQNTTRVRLELLMRLVEVLPDISVSFP